MTMVGTTDLNRPVRSRAAGPAGTTIPGVKWSQRHVRRGPWGSAC